MTSVFNNQPTIILTERGLTISGTRITLYDVMDYGGHAEILLGNMGNQGWLELLPIRFVTIKEINLSTDSSDRVVWQISQKKATQHNFLNESQTPTPKEAL